MEKGVMTLELHVEEEIIQQLIKYYFKKNTGF